MLSSHLFNLDVVIPSHQPVIVSCHIKFRMFKKKEPFFRIRRSLIAHSRRHLTHTHLDYPHRFTINDYGYSIRIIETSPHIMGLSSKNCPRPMANTISYGWWWNFVAVARWLIWSNPLKVPVSKRNGSLIYAGKFSGYPFIVIEALPFFPGIESFASKQSDPSRHQRSKCPLNG